MKQMVESQFAPLTSAPPSRRSQGAVWVVGVAAALLLYLLSRSNYLLFHGIVELFSIVVGAAVFVVAWNTRKWVSNHYLLFLGIAFAFVAMIDVFHMLAYRGMGVFPGFTSNQPTQFWILARYVQAFSLLLAPLFLTRRLRPERCIAVFAVVVGLGLASICRLGIFPDCFIDGHGLTAFKVASEYAISAVLLVALWLLYVRRSALEPRVFRFLAAAILAGVAAEMSFTLYTDVYGIANMAGHLFKVLSFYLVYRAVVVTSLATPYEMLFRDLAQSKDQLQHERDLSRTYIDIAGAMLVVLDRDGRVQLINQRGAEVLGYEKEEILGHDWFNEFLPPDDRVRVRAAFDALMAGRLEFAAYVENHVLARDGTGRLIAWHNTVLRDADGAIAGTLGSGEDITEQRNAEQRLRQSEERFRKLFEQSVDAVYLIAPDGTILNVNAAAVKLFGYGRDELLGMRVTTLYAEPASRPAVLAKSHAEGGLRDFPMQFRRKDGELRDCEVTSTILRDPEGVLDGYQTLIRDITRRKRAEDALRGSEAKYRSLFEQTRDAIVLTSPDGSVVDANPAFLSLFGYAQDDLSGLRMPDLLADPQDVDEFVARLRREDGIVDDECRFKKKNGDIMDCLRTIVVWRSETGEVVAHQGLIRDVTEQKRAERELLRNEARLLSLVSILQHESTTVQDFVDYALNEAIALTESRIGYIYFYDEERREFTLNTWSRDVMKECTIQEAQTVYRLEKTGIWGEAVRQRRPIVVNDFAAPHPLKKGYPEGHAALRKYATVPVLSAGRIVAVVGVANKETDYTDTDVLQLTLLMDSVWKEVERKQSQEQVMQFSERLEHAMSAGNLAWWQMALPSGTVVFDARKATMLGYAPSDFSHYSEFTALLHPDDYERAMQAMRDHLEGNAERYEVEYRIRTGSGAYHWFRDVGGVTQRGPDGKPSLVTGIVVDITGLKDAEERLAASNKDLRALAARLDVAREEERAAVAWELHDEVAQALAVIRLDITSCSSRLPVDALARVGATLDRIVALLDSTIARLRKLYTDLVPVMLEDLGLAVAIEWHAEQSSHRGTVTVRAGRVEDLTLRDERTTLGLFRILQELVDHVSTHPGTKNVMIDLEQEDGHAVLRVTDDGDGFARVECEEACAMVLAGVRERARFWGGEVSVQTTPSRGTVVKVTAPLRND